MMYNSQKWLLFGVGVFWCCYNTVRDYMGLASTSSLLVNELFSPVNVITSSLLVAKSFRYARRVGGEVENVKWP